jgi:hypothetical protein
MVMMMMMMMMIFSSTSWCPCAGASSRANDRGRKGEGGAKVWGLVLYEVAPEHVTDGERFFEHTVHAMNNGRAGGSGTAVDAENFLSYARVRVGRKQGYLSNHANIVRARVVHFPVQEPEGKGGRKKPVAQWYQ